ncbi:MAG TPA: multidrug efflux RND transporter permease subunit [Thermoanaerobaculia bacterium]|jgi:multidrug efflux pump|nr:multidrug efflux RND transporter permease subunit [Thermoanaerobaculia bacterium]
MSFSEPFIRRPVGTSLLSVAILMAGALGYMNLPVAPLPQVEFPTISVNAGLPGADPETMASSVATPLERQFGRIAGVTQMTSNSSSGSTNVTLQFELDRDIDAAARDVQAAINAARGQLPANLPSNPNWRKVNPADAPIMILGLTSDVKTQPQMYDVADSVLAQKIAQIDGIGQVFVGGSSRPAVRVEVNPLQLSKLNVGIDQVRAAIGTANANRPKGSISGPGNVWMLQTNDQLFKANEYRSLIVASRDGKPVILSEVARVEDSVENINSAGSVNGKPAISLVLFRQPGANIIGTVDRVRSMIPQLQATIPPSIHLDVVLDRTGTIRASVIDVEWTLGISILLVILVVFLFLRSGWATVIPSVAVPLSLIGTFGVMYLLGYSLDNLSLMALTISTGFVVDDAIVVIENISRHLEDGMKALDAALLGAREIGFTVFSMSTSLIAVFIPILLMGGIVGRLFREFAVTLSVAIVFSLIISLTTTPMMCAKFLRSEKDRKHGRFYRVSERAFDHLRSGYEHTLDVVLDHRLPVLLVTLATIGFTIYLYIVIPKGFFPSQDTGRLNGNVQGAQDTSFSALIAKLNQFMRIVEKDPAVESVVSFTGGGRGGSSASMFVTLKPLNVRKASAQEIIARLRPKTSHIPGAQLFLTAVQDVRVGGRQSNAEYQYTLQGDNVADVMTWAPKLSKAMQKMKELKDVSSDQQNQGLQASVVIDRQTAARLGVSLASIDSTLYDAFGQRQVSVMYSGMNQYHVVMEVDPKFSNSPAALSNVYVHSSTGREVPLSAIAHFGLDQTPLSVPHQGQFPAVTISFNLAPGVSLGNATAAIEDEERKMGMPSSIHPGFQGTAQAFQQSLSTEPMLILAALLAVYIVLGILYESLVHPITILSTIPSAGVGALIALLLTNTEFTIIALIGIILLIGIVKKNAIMMIDFALEAERKHGKSAREAIREACLLRFRPIMMTTMAALFGGLPLALGGGTGSELRRPLGIAIVGGLIMSQMLTLFTTPVTYMYLDKLRLRGREKEPAAEPVGA